MQRRYILLILLSAGLCLVTTCDFPADPPLKIKSNLDITTPGNDNVLLPLTGKEKWSYLVEVGVRPVLPLKIVAPRKIELGDFECYYLPYIYHLGNPTAQTFAFPPFLRNDSLGLAFYQPLYPEDTVRLSHQPKFVFRLPYPVPKGSNIPTGGYRVICTHTDTVMTLPAGDFQFPAHRYEVRRSGTITHVFYVVPGVALLRIDSDQAVFRTVAWSL